MKNKMSYILFVFVLVISGCNKSPNSTDYQQFTEVKYNEEQSLDKFAKEIQQYYLLPGVAIAKISGTAIEEVAIVGHNKVKNGTALNSKSKFQIGSCGKSFTALLVASFVEEGSITWETKIADIFTDMETHKGFNNTTIRKLLSHTAGLRHFWSDEEVYRIKSIIPDLEGTTTKKRIIFTEWNMSQKPYFNSGEYQYSNGGYIIVAAMLEKITGKPFEQLMEERIFIPLNLNSAEFDYPGSYDPSQPQRHIRRYNGGMGISLDSSERLVDPIFNPAGFISLSIMDFAQFVIFHIKALKGEETWISPSIVQELFKPLVSTEKGNEIGMGWMIIYVDGTKTYGHTGSDGTIRSVMTIDPETWNGAVFATNIGDVQAEKALINVVVELLN